MTLAAACNKPGSTQKMLEYSQFMQELKQGKVERVGLSTDRSKALVQAKDGTKAIVKLNPNDTQLIDVLVANVKGGIYILPN
jgi:cell division protease FtsH